MTFLDALINGRLSLLTRTIRPRIAIPVNVHSVLGRDLSYVSATYRLSCPEGVCCPRDIEES